MERQEEKYHLSLSGEFFVAAELQRRGISATITYGNAKKTDIVAFSKTEEKAVTIEVKTTRKNKWPIGNRVPEPTQKDKLWIFVLIPEDKLEYPKYYILFQSELHKLLRAKERDYFKKFLKKHKEKYGNRHGVATLSIKQAGNFKDAWEKVFIQLKQDSE